MKKFILLILLFLSAGANAQNINVYYDLASDVTTTLNQLVLSDKRTALDKKLNSLYEKYPKLNTIIIFIQGPKYHKHYMSKYFKGAPRPLAKINYQNPNIVNVSIKANYILIDTEQNKNVYYRITLDK